MNSPSYAWYCDSFLAATERFTQVIRGQNLASEVSTCPGWTLAKLTRHLGSVHRWANALVRTQSAERIDPRQLDLRLPAEESGYADWLADGAAELAGSLRRAHPETPVWSWGGDHRAHFWARRALHETTIHRADAEMSLGEEPSIDAETAVDGIDEFLDNLQYAAAFAPKVKELRGGGESLHWHSTDAEGEWTVRLTADGFIWERGHGKGTVAVRGRVADLLLLLWGRRRRADPRFECFGDESLLERWQELSAI